MIAFFLLQNIQEIVVTIFWIVPNALCWQQHQTRHSLVTVIKYASQKWNINKQVKKEGERENLMMCLYIGALGRWDIPICHLMQSMPCQLNCSLNKVLESEPLNHPTHPMRQILKWTTTNPFARLYFFLVYSNAKCLKACQRLTLSSRPCESIHNNKTHIKVEP